MALLANINRDSKKKSKPYNPIDFMPKWDEVNVEEKTEQSVEQQKQIFFNVIKGLKKDKK